MYVPKNKIYNILEKIRILFLAYFAQKLSEKKGPYGGRCNIMLPRSYCISDFRQY